ncbi:MAG: hypothetical protein ACTSWR_06950 [Candidatus Helarchaeota archaeon]
MDCAAHCLSTWVTNGIIPNGYNHSDWFNGVYNAINYTKSLLKDKILIYNGIHSDCEEQYDSKARYLKIVIIEIHKYKKINFYMKFFKKYMMKRNGN